MITTTAPDVRLAALDFDPPEYVTSHKVPDLEHVLAWGLVPGVALCGFILAAANEMGPTRQVAGDPRFVVKPCQPCLDDLAPRL